MSLSGYCVYFPLVPGPVFFGVVVSRFSFHQVPGFSGRRLVRTVSTSPLLVSLVAPWSLRSTSLSLPILSSPALLSPCFLCVLASRVPFLFPASLSLLFFLCLLFLSSLLLTPLAADWSGLSGLSLLLSPFPLLFCFLLHPRVLCLVFLAADWSGFPTPPSSPSFLLSFTSLIPDLLSRRDLRLSVIFLAADWSGVSHCWLPSQTIPPPNQARSLAADWSGALLLTTYSWYSSQDNKPSSHV